MSDKNSDRAASADRSTGDLNLVGSFSWLAIKLVLVIWLLLKPIKVVVIEYQQF